MSRDLLTRRGFLKWAGASLAAASAATVLGACGQQPEPTEAPAPAEPTAAVSEPTAAPAPAEAKTLVVAIQAFAHEAMEPVLAAWEAKTGHKVTLESGPASGQEMLTKYAPQFQSGTSSASR